MSIICPFGKECGEQPGMRYVPAVLLAFVLSASLVSAQSEQAGPGQDDRRVPTFRSSAERVTVSAVVRDHKGRVVQDLAPRDFQLLDGGVPRQITDFRADGAPISLALLFDASGSMQVASKVVRARQAAALLLAMLQPGRDETALFTFDTRLRQVQPFSRVEANVNASLDQVEPYGMTSLHDAIAETARIVARHGGSQLHRAVVVLTDGLDNASQLSPEQVSGIASAIDVPVYIVSVVLPVDREEGAVEAPDGAVTSALTNLAQWTGGEFYLSSSPSETSVVTRRIVDDMRHQYLIAFEPGEAPGWHALQVKTRHKGLVVRARSGYFSGKSATDR